MVSDLDPTEAPRKRAPLAPAAHTEAISGSPPGTDRPADLGRPPWEERADVGALTAFVATVGRVLIHPRAFFVRLPAKGPVAEVILFWMLTTLPPLMVSGAGTHHFLERLPDLINVDPASIPFHFPLWVFVMVLPLLQLVALLSAVLLVHLMLSLLGGAGGGLVATLRAAGYASAPALVGLLPLVGGLVAGLWVGVLQYYALWKVHRTGHTRMVLAYLLPALLAVALGIVLAAALVPVISPLVDRYLAF
jgi:hypothetical protein